jgi:gamma-glutamyltranspeptidase/glutathione hydrolase
MPRDSSASPGLGLVVAPQAEAAYEGARVLDDGGNAADALVTAAFVQGIVDPHRSGAGGFGCATLWFGGEGSTAGGSGRALAVDFHGRAGSRASPEQWEALYESAAPDGFGYVVRDQVNDVGYASITVPGMVAGVSEIHSRFGRLPWGELVERAVPYAEDGFLVTPELAEFWIRPGLYGRVSTRDRLAFSEAGRRICFKADGETYKSGETFRQPELARTYRRLAREGPDSFYRGSLAAEMAADWERRGALMTAADLAAYRPLVHEPLRGRYRDLEVLTSPLPGGGVALLQVLKLVEARSLSRLEHNSAELIHELGRILQAVWRDRLAHHGDPAFGAPPPSEFLDPEYLERLIDQSEAPAPPDLLRRGAESENTTQLSIADGWGNAISFSHSLGYNSGVFAPGLGILFNNCMSAFDPRPGRRNSIAPGKARSTAVAETILLREGRPALVLGSPGAARITAGLAQVIINAVDYGRSIAEAVLEPRFDAYGPGKLLLESRFPPPLVRALAARGWEVQQSPKPFGMIGRVYAIDTAAEPGGPAVAGVDPGAPGAAYRQRRPPGAGSGR